MRHHACCTVQLLHLTVCGASRRDDRVEPEQAEEYRAAIVNHLPTKDVPRDRRLEVFDVRGEVSVAHTLVQDFHRHFVVITPATSLAMAGLLVLSSSFPCGLACCCIAQSCLVSGLHATSALSLQDSDCEAVQQLCLTCMNLRC